MHPFDLGLAMGLIAGEGSFTHHRRRPVLSVKLRVEDLCLLCFLRGMFGGTIYGPYQARTCRYCTWVLAGAALRQALPVLLRCLPDCHKREQLRAWLDAYFPHPPARPA